MGFRWSIGLCDRLLRGCGEGKTALHSDARAGLEAVIAVAGGIHGALLDHAYSGHGGVATVLGGEGGSDRECRNGGARADARMLRPQTEGERRIQ